MPREIKARAQQWLEQEIIQYDEAVHLSEAETDSGSERCHEVLDESDQQSIPMGNGKAGCA